MGSRLQPALLGGVFIGVLSSLPFVSALNACCCLWVIVGGVLTAYLLQERTSLPITAGDGAIAGLLAGLIAAVVTAILGAAFAAFGGLDMRGTIDQMLSRGDLPPEFAASLERFRDVPGTVWFLMSFAIGLVVYPVFAMIGSLIGVALFRKKTPPLPPTGTVEVLPPE